MRVCVCVCAAAILERRAFAVHLKGDWANEIGLRFLHVL